MPLQTVEPQRLYRQIAGQLRTLITAGEWAVGTRLPAERDLARQLGVSRPSVREALIAMEVEGWVEVRTGSGVYVLDRANTRHSAASKAMQISPDEWGPLELIRARRVVEGEVAAMAATLAKRKHIDAMGKAIANMTVDANAGVLKVDNDHAFHTALVESCGNVVLIETVQRYWASRRGPLYGKMEEHFETVKSWRWAIDEHTMILDAVKNRDAGAARLAMHQHMDKAHTRFSVSWRLAKDPKTQKR